MPSKNNRAIEILQSALAKKKAQEEQQMRANVMKDLGPQIVKALNPVLQQIARTATVPMEQMVKAISTGIRNGFNGIDFHPQIHVDSPTVNVPDVHVPKADAPQVHVTVPEIKIPDIKMPSEIETRGFLNLIGWDSKLLQSPIPVQLRDKDGKPVSINLGGGNSIVSGSSGKADYFTIRDIRGSSASIIDQVEGALKITGTLSASVSTSTLVSMVNSDGNYYNSDNPLPVTITSGASATTATNIVDSSGVAYSGSNPVPVVFGASATQAVNMVDSGGVAYSGSNPVPVSGTVVVSSVTATTAASIVDSTGAQYSGSNPVPMTGTVVVSSITASTAASLVDSSGIQYSGSNPVPITWVSGAGVSTAVHITDSGGVGYSGSNPIPVNLISQSLASSASALVDSTGVQYSGSNPLPISWVSGAGNSTVVVGPVAADVAADASAPIKGGGIARQANPTAVAAGDIVSSSYDDIGRQLVRPVQVRDLTLTAYTSITNGTEATLLAASAGSFHDLVYIMAANNSDAAVTLDVRAVTAGNIAMSIVVPPYGTAGVAPSVPIPGSGTDTGNNWTIDMTDITGTTVYVTALFSREV